MGMRRAGLIGLGTLALLAGGCGSQQTVVRSQPPGVNPWNNLNDDQGQAVAGVQCYYCPGSAAGSSDVAGPGDDDGDGVANDLDQCGATPPGVRTDAAGCWILETVHFATGRVDLSPESRAALDELVTLLQDKPGLRLDVTGHADSTGDWFYNDQLSWIRARRVVDYLWTRGISKDRMRAVGYGEGRPEAGNDNPAGRARNRRVALQLLQ